MRPTSLASFGAILCVLGAWSGCAFSPDQCNTSADCPDGKACVLDGDVFLCRMESEPTNSEDPNTPDLPADQTNSTANTNTGDLPSCGSSCVTDVFEPNNSLTDAALFTTDILGCQRFEFQTYDLTLPASMCGDEDWYTLELNPCEDRSYLLEIEVNLTTACTLETWQMLGDWDCLAPQVACSETNTGRRTRFLIRSEDERRWAEGLRFGIKSTGARTGYTIRVTVIP